MLAIGQGGFGELAGNALLAADQFHHHIGVAGGQRQRVGDKVGNVEAARLFCVAGGNRHDVQLAAGAGGQIVVARRQRLDHAAADRAQTGDGDLERLHFALSRSAGALLVPWERNFFTLRAAWRMRCSFSTSATRT